MALSELQSKYIRFAEVLQHFQEGNCMPRRKTYGTKSRSLNEWLQPITQFMKAMQLELDVKTTLLDRVLDRKKSRCNNSDYINNTPEHIRWANENTDPVCKRAVDKVRNLGNDPEYECNASIREQWAEAVKYANSLGCTL